MLRASRLRSLARDISFAGVAGGSADFVCQRLESGLAVLPPDEAAPSYDWRRSFAFSTFTGLYIGGVCTPLYSLYPRIAASLFRSPSPNVSGAVATLCDNFVHVPFLYLPAFYLGTGALRGESSAEMADGLRRNWAMSVASCLSFWLPAQFVIFSMVPAAYRVRCVASCDFVWNVALSFIAHRREPISDAPPAMMQADS